MAGLLATLKDDGRVTSVEFRRLGRGEAWECLVRRSEPPYLVKGSGPTPELALEETRIDMRGEK